MLVVRWQYFENGQNSAGRAFAICRQVQVTKLRFESFYLYVRHVGKRHVMHRFRRMTKNGTKRVASCCIRVSCCSCLSSTRHFELARVLPNTSAQLLSLLVIVDLKRRNKVDFGTSNDFCSAWPSLTFPRILLTF